MKTVRVKICGITNEKDLIDAANAGADALGFVVGVQSSSRNLSVEQARSLLAKVPPFISTVVVTKESNTANLKRLNSALRPCFLQVYSDIDECESALKGLNEHVAAILGVDGEGSSVEELVRVSRFFHAFLLDTLSPAKSGGTGHMHDWNASRLLREALDPKPIVLAGGLTPENVADAVRMVKPYAVDVATGVELSPGKKDQAKLVQFIKNAKGVQL